METGELDPFVIMETEFLKQRKQRIKPVVIIDELQAIDHIYITNGNERQLIIELVNFFVAMTKESHLAHVIIAYYTEFDKNKQLVLKVVNDKKIVRSTDLEDLSIKALELKELLRDMVRNNILYFDPTKAIYYPQGKSYQWGIKLYFEGI